MNTASISLDLGVGEQVKVSTISELSDIQNYYKQTNDLHMILLPDGVGLAMFINDGYEFVLFVKDYPLYNLREEQNQLTLTGQEETIKPFADWVSLLQLGEDRGIYQLHREVVWG